MKVGESIGPSKVQRGDTGIHEDTQTPRDMLTRTSDPTRSRNPKPPPSGKEKETFLFCLIIRSGCREGKMGQSHFNGQKGACSSRKHVQ